MSMIEVSIHKLVLSERYQARKTPGQQPVDELAASIAAQGLLQNLVVTNGRKRGTYEVVAGGRRLQALQRLAADGRWPQDRAILVQCVQAEDALEASITENVQREAMHPADEFDAFAALVEQGKPIEDIAARFGVSANVVRQRMKLAAVAPDLIQAYRDNALSLESLMAFAITDDQQRQLDVWSGLNSWDRKHLHANRIRAMLKDQAWTASHPLVRFVGLDAYRAAGGAVFHDLFADNGDPQGIYIEHPDILQRLATEKLQAEAERLGQGWSWADFALSYDEAAWAGYSNKFGRVYAEDRKLSKAEAARIKALSQTIETVEARMEALEEHYDNADDESIAAWNSLDQQLTALQAEQAEIQAAARIWSDEAKAVAGVGLYVDGQGKLDVTYGLIRPEDRRAAIEASNTDAADGKGALRTSLPPPATRPQHSERLVRQLTAHKVGIVSADLAEKPAIALAVLVAQLAMDVLGPGWKKGFGLGISLKNEYPHQHAPDFVGSKAHQTMEALKLHWMDNLPLDERGDLSDAVLPWALEQDQTTLVELLAFLVAGSAQGVQHQEPTTDTPLDVLARAAGTDISAWWEPTAESYFAHVSKDVIAQAVTEGADGDTAAPLAKIKKGEAAAAAESALAGSGWLPTPIRIFDANTEKVDA